MSAFGALSLFGPLIGPVDMPTLSYHGEIDFSYTNPSFECTSTASHLFLQNLGYPFPSLNFSSETGNDSVWGFTVAATSPATMEIENESGVFSSSFTLVSTIGTRNWNYFYAKESIYWLNASASLDQVNLRIAARAPFAWPWLTVTSSAGPTSSGVYAFTTLRPATASSQITVSGNNLTLRMATGEIVNLTGNARLTFRSFELAYFWLSTQRHSFLLQPGTQIAFFWSGLTVHDASGYFEASNGDQRPFSNATVSTLSSPRSTEFEVASRPDNSANVTLRVGLESTTLRVVDEKADTVLGQHNKDLISISSWPGTALNILMVVLGTMGIFWLAWVARPED